ncbi:MAG: hypothetical protein MK100_09665, partial [Phycisphaerales bacterium]|nr:hypothetical protein [Phycisphaerales bacterium]
MLKLTASLVLFVLSTSVLAQDAVQWRVEDGGNGHWYDFIPDDTKTYAGHFENAEAIGAHLITITSAEENAFAEYVRDLENSGGAYIAGGFRTGDGSDDWAWVTGEEWSYTNWENGEPTSFQALGIRGQNDGTWEALATTTEWYAIYEYSADCNGDGIVDYGQILDGTFADDNGNGVPDLCDAVQWRVEDGGNGHWYRIFSAPGISWAEAEQQAEDLSGHLSSLTSAEENGFVVNQFANGMTTMPWIGLRQDNDGDWGWNTGETYAWTNWSPTEPNGGSIEVEAIIWLTDAPPDRPLGTWNDYKTPHPNGGLIEWSADCNADGIVDFGQILDGSVTDCNGNFIPDVCDISDTFAASVERTPESITDFIEFDVSAIADANDTVTLSITAVGDLAGSGESLWVYLDGMLLDIVFVDDGAACEEVTTTLNILATEWNDAGADGSRLVKVSGTNIDPDACAEPRVGISVIVPIPFDDCDNSRTWDACDIASGLASDLDGNGIPDSCDPDCDGDGEPDAYEISSGQALDCNANEIPDSCDIAEGGSSSDVDSDGVPDECQPDCDGDGVPDSWELSEGLAMDCNTNSYPDNCDILEGTSNDIDSNGVPDECKDDCNGNGIPDYWEIKQGDVADCDGNSVPDPCDIAAGNLPDC